MQWPDVRAKTVHWRAATVTFALIISTVPALLSVTPSSSRASTSDPEPTFPAPATDDQEADLENARLNDALGARFSLISTRFSQMSARFSQMATQISSGTLEIGTE